MKIFIVEDELIVALSLQLKMQELGYVDTTIFPSGEQALKQLPAGKPDLLIMDINLPGTLNGLETVERIYQDHYAPVIFLTGYSDKSVRNSAQRFKPLGFFVKPVDIAELHSLIQETFGPAGPV